MHLSTSSNAWNTQELDAHHVVINYFPVSFYTVTVKVWRAALYQKQDILLLIIWKMPYPSTRGAAGMIGFPLQGKQQGLLVVLLQNPGMILEEISWDRPCNLIPFSMQATAILFLTCSHLASA